MKTINNIEDFCGIVNQAIDNYKRGNEGNYGTYSIKEIAEVSGLLEDYEYDQNWLDTYEGFYLCSETGEMTPHCDLSLINHAAGDCYVKTELFGKFFYALADMGAGAELIENDPTAAYLLWKMEGEASSRDSFIPRDGKEFVEACRHLDLDPATNKVRCIHRGVASSEYYYCLDDEWSYAGTYRVEDTETGNAVFYKGDSAIEAVKAALEAMDGEDGFEEVDIYKNNERVFCGATDAKGELFGLLSTQETVGDNIAAARHAAGMSQQDLADKTGLRQATIADIETGKSDCRISTLQTIAVALDCNIADLFE